MIENKIINILLLKCGNQTQSINQLIKNENSMNLKNNCDAALVLKLIVCNIIPFSNCCV